MGEQHLHVSQGNALVYCSLVGFGLVGMAAGWHLKKKDFISGVRTQKVLPLTLNWIASSGPTCICTAVIWGLNSSWTAWLLTLSVPYCLIMQQLTLVLCAAMSSSLLFAYPQVAVMPGSGILGCAAYAFATALPLWFFCWLGPKIRKLAPEGFVLSAFFQARFGWPLGVLSAMIFIGVNWASMLVELNTYGSVVSLLGGVDATVAAVIVAVITTIYTTYGGFRASLWTDNVNGVIIILLIIIAGAAVGKELNITKERIDASGLAKPEWLGATLWWILPNALLWSQFINQGFWQRAFASKNDRTLFWSVVLASPIIFAICFLVGMTGPLAEWAGLFDGVTDSSDGEDTFFEILATLPAWVQGIVLVLCGCLSSSAYDTFQSAQISTIYGNLFCGKVNIWICRVLLVLINVPAVVVAVKQININEVFSVVDMCAAAVLPAPLLGLAPALWFLNGFDVIVGIFGGFLTIFLYGLVFFKGDARQAGYLLGLWPGGLYVDNYSVFGAFFAAPIGSILWTFAGFAVRAGAMWVVCRITKLEYDVFDKEKRALRPYEWTTDEGRPVDLVPSDPEGQHYAHADGEGSLNSEIQEKKDRLSENSHVHHDQLDVDSNSKSADSKGEIDGANNVHHELPRF